MTADLKAAQLASDISAMRTFATEKDAIILDRQLPALKASAANILSALDQAAEALKPFDAVMREHQEGLAPDPDRHAWGFNRSDLYWRDFIRAATVYATLKPERGA